MDCRCHTFHSLLSEHRKSLGLGVPESLFKTAIGIIVIAIIIDLRPYYNCRTTLVQLSIQLISRLHTLLLSHGIWYTNLKILFRVRPSSILSRTPNKYRKLYQVFHLYCGLNYQRVVSSIPNQVTRFLFSDVP